MTHDVEVDRATFGLPVYTHKEFRSLDGVAQRRRSGRISTRLLVAARAGVWRLLVARLHLIHLYL